MSYLLQIADELMSIPIGELAEMYNAAEERAQNSDIEESTRYKRIMLLIDQVAVKRLYVRKGESTKWYFSR